MNDKTVISDDVVAAMFAAQSSAPPPDEDALARMQRLGSEVLSIDAEIEKLEERQKLLSSRRNQILSRDLVDVMDSKRIPEVTVGDTRFLCGNYAKASLPSDNPDPGLNWLEENGEGGLINYQVIVSLPKDCEEEAREIERTVRERWQQATVERKRTVPWARLTSWLKEYKFELMPKNINLPAPPLDALGATVGRVVRLERPRRKK